MATRPVKPRTQGPGPIAKLPWSEELQHEILNVAWAQIHNQGLNLGITTDFGAAQYLYAVGPWEGKKLPDPRCKIYPPFSDLRF